MVGLWVLGFSEVGRVGPWPPRPVGTVARQTDAMSKTTDPLTNFREF
jgi:hypothetical protein